MVTVLKVYIVRHGETQANLSGIIQGQLDTELNEEGLRQAGLLAERMKSIPIHFAFTSDLTRAKKTAEAVLAHHPRVELQETEKLREQFMGTLQGGKYNSLTYKTLVQNDRTIETRENMSDRLLTWWEESVLPLAKRRQEEVAALNGLEPPANVLATSHGGAISTLFRVIMSEGLVVRAPGVLFTRCWNTSISVIEVDESLKGRVTMYADISHLLGAAVVQTNVDEDVRL